MMQRCLVAKSQRQYPVPLQLGTEPCESISSRELAEHWFLPLGSAMVAIERALLESVREGHRGNKSLLYAEVSIVRIHQGRSLRLLRDLYKSAMDSVQAGKKSAYPHLLVAGIESGLHESILLRWAGNAGERLSKTEQHISPSGPFYSPDNAAGDRPGN